MSLLKKILLILFVILLIIIVEVIAIVPITYTTQIDNVVNIIAVEIDVSPTLIDWGDFTYELAETKLENISITNTRNTDVSVTFSDNLLSIGGDSLYMVYPESFVLSAGDTVIKELSLVYENGTSTGFLGWGEYNWDITVTATQS